MGKWGKPWDGGKESAPSQEEEEEEEEEKKIIAKKTLSMDKFYLIF